MHITVATNQMFLISFCSLFSLPDIHESCLVFYRQQLYTPIIQFIILISNKVPLNLTWKQLSGLIINLYKCHVDGSVSSHNLKYVPISLGCGQRLSTLSLFDSINIPLPNGLYWPSLWNGQIRKFFRTSIILYSTWLEGTTA